LRAVTPTQRQLKVLMCAELVGSNRLEHRESFSQQLLLNSYRAAIDTALAEEGGRVFDSTSGKLFLEFPAALDAVTGAMRVQRLVAKRNARLPVEKRFFPRIGLHLGEANENCTVKQLVEATAQVQRSAAPGDICISQAVQATAHRNLETMIRAGGTRTLGNGPGATLVYTLAAPGARSFLSLAILPFADLSHGAGPEYLAAGITEHLVRELARIERSSIIDPTVTSAYRGDARDVATLGGILGAHYVVKGSIRDGAQGLRVTAELTDAVTGEHLWTDRFDLAVRDPLAMERDAVMRLVPPLHAHLLAADGRPPQPPPPLLMQANGADTSEAAIVMHPRGTPLASNVPSAPAAQAVPLFIEPVQMISPSHHKAMAFLRRFIKVIVVGIVGLFAFIIVDEHHRGWAIEVAAWMLVAFGFVQMVGALGEAPPEG
jgi:adenylate cyclase